MLATQRTEPLPFDREQANEFLHLLYPDNPPGYLAITSHVDDRWPTRFFEASDIEGATNAIGRAGLLHDTYFGVATRQSALTNGTRGGKDNCHAVPGLWLDIDMAVPGHHASTAGLPVDANDVNRLLESIGLPAPSASVHTGGGLHCWWVFDEPKLVNDVAELIEEFRGHYRSAAHAVGFTLDNVSDVSRLMRLPGTWNFKCADPKPVIWL